MSAELQSPTLPTSLSLEDIKKYIESTVQNTIENRIVPIIESVVRRVLAERTPIETVVETVLATSELKVLKRISTVETVLGLNDFAEDEHKTILARLEAIEHRTIAVIEKPTEEKTPEPDIPRTTLELKAISLVERLRIKPRSRNGEVFMDNSELTKFLTQELPTELRSEDSNLRRVKKRVIEKAKSLFPDSIFINKSKYGRHETRIILTESYLCKGTVQYI